MIENFHFIRPWMLLILPIGLCSVYLLWIRIKNDSGWSKVCDSHLINHLLVNQKNQRSKLIYFAMAVLWSLVSLAMAGPTWQKVPENLYKPIQSRIIVFDLSRSMNSQDLQPTRLERARYKLIDLILTGVGIQQGLIVFAGDAFVVSPLTDDSDTIINLIASLDTQTLPIQGSRADLGLELEASLDKN